MFASFFNQELILNNLSVAAQKSAAILSIEKTTESRLGPGNWLKRPVQLLEVYSVRKYRNIINISHSITWNLAANVQKVRYGTDFRFYTQCWGTRSGGSACFLGLPDPNLLVREVPIRKRFRTKMSRIPNLTFKSYLTGRLCNIISVSKNLWNAMLAGF